jgi:hypothetical protein
MSVSADASIFHAALWLILILTIGVALLMVVFGLCCRCAHWLGRSSHRALDEHTHTWPQA